MALEWQSDYAGFLEIDGTRIEYTMHGEPHGEKPVLVLLHEGLGSVSTWKDIPKRISQIAGLRVFTFSRVGYGKSSPCELPRPIDYMTREAQVFLPPILDQIGAEAYILVGHSDGASIAAIYAGSAEDFRVRGLVLIAPHFFTEPMGLESIQAAKQAYQNGDLKERLSRHHDNVDNAFHGWNAAWLDPEFKVWDITEVIDYWRIPALGIQGENDEYGTLRQIEVMSERSYAPVDECIIPDCGHAPHRDKPEALLDAIKEFTDRLTRIEAEDVKVA